MKNNYLHLLAKQILKVIPKGLSKVRFAKILYFTHKGLVQKNLSAPNEMEFIRMPLGPVPVGFKGLDQDPEIKVTEIATSLLIYDKHLYVLQGMKDYFKEAKLKVIQQISLQLNCLTTTQLVNKAHEEPSWLNHKNGEEYFLERADLEINLPTSKTTNISSEIDTQHLQAKLVEGMLDDIVDESTSLEYPNSNK
ncbi:hypothetical protein A2617_03950 [Candidatus Daviesbacteria bacterium RIFOXYD1_FULL_41_10]|uniref:Antitoxin SocA-like Panacea domain-containing protein n=2 Tax=Candidatus Daviesiibacteriota TaxID=1752718 RepID=A0A1F5MZY1_9BACT|nr:MAG: hypothetical protein UU67_C0003G0041 [Candidatus Daviesbacteria bacterium GW2011_GWB1_41_5]OGE70969.1 MAG: hypothetical protein A2617_03950 [Candidatus Daviesbacteria bacterium RIFOXYD1_FULL_41_10]